MAKLKFSDISTLARITNTSEGILPYGNSWREDATTRKPIDPEGEIEAVTIYGSHLTLTEFDNLMRDLHGFQFKWAKDGCGTYLRINADRVEF
jgi:hypothetical protein